eukprot:UN13894
MNIRIKLRVISHQHHSREVVVHVGKRVHGESGSLIQNRTPFHGQYWIDALTLMDCLVVDQTFHRLIFRRSNPSEIGRGIVNA